MKMKLLVLRSFFLVLVTGMILSSCSKDDSATDPIVGTWTAGTPTFSAMVGSKTLTQYFMEDMGLSQADANTYTAMFNLLFAEAFTGTITVKSNNTYTSTLGGEPDSGTWSLNSDKTELTIDSTDGDPMTLEVIELTSSKLRIHGSETVSEDLNSDGTPENIIVDIELVFTK
jgi:hypothetical protein